MHLINYLQPIYASLVAGHVFCTSNGTPNGFENQLSGVMRLALQETAKRSLVRRLPTTRSRCMMSSHRANLHSLHVKLVSRSWRSSKNNADE